MSVLDEVAQLENKKKTPLEEALEIEQSMGQDSQRADIEPTQYGYPPRYKWKAQGQAGIGETLQKKEWGDAIPFVGGFLTLGRFADIKSKMDRLEKHASGEKTLSEEELRAYQQDLEKFQLEADYAQTRGQTIPAEIVNGVIDQVPFWLEFMATGPAAKVVKSGITKAAKAGMKAGLINTSKYGARAASLPAQALARTAMMPDMLAENYGRNLLNEDSPSTRVVKAFLDTWIEAFSEQTGGVLTKYVGKGKEALIKPFQERLGVEWINALPGRTYTDFVNKISTEAGFHGVLEEMGEERVGGMLRAITGVQDFGLSGEENTMANRLVESIPSPRDLLVEFGTFSVPAMGIGAARAADQWNENRFPTQMKRIQEDTNAAFDQYEQALKGVPNLYGANEIRQYSGSIDFFDKKRLLTPKGALDWIGMDPESASRMATIEDPSRKDFKDAHIPGQFNAEERKRFRTMVSLILGQEPLQAAQEQAPPIPEEPSQQVAPPQEPPVQEPLIEEPPIQETPVTTPTPATEGAPPLDEGQFVPPQEMPPVQPESPPSVTAAPEDASSLVPEELDKRKILFNGIRELLDSGVAIDSKKLFSLADKAFGGTRAQGVYGPSEVYDILESAMNAYARDLKEEIDPSNAEETLETLKSVTDLVMNQTNRSGEKDLLQQFSTPMEYAYLAAWAANIGSNDFVLEPSAGTGGLAVWGDVFGAKKVHVNEISPNRLFLLANLGYENFTDLDAEHLYHLWKGEQPDVVLMNPPFSHAGHRMGNKKILGMDRKHVDQALKVLKPGGRLVAIMGAPLHGDETKGFKEWYNRIKKDFNVRANVFVNRDVYKKMGTNFPTRILIIDKDAIPTSEVVKGQANTLEQLAEMLKGIRDDRTVQETGRTEQPPIKPNVSEGDGKGENPPQQRETVQPPVSSVEGEEKGDSGHRDKTPGHSDRTDGSAGKHGERGGSPGSRSKSGRPSPDSKGGEADKGIDEPRDGGDTRVDSGGSDSKPASKPGIRDIPLDEISEEDFDSLMEDIWGNDTQETKTEEPPAPSQETQSPPPVETAPQEKKRLQPKNKEEQAPPKEIPRSKEEIEAENQRLIGELNDIFLDLESSGDTLAKMDPGKGPAKAAPAIKEEVYKKVFPIIEKIYKNTIEGGGGARTFLEALQKQIPASGMPYVKKFFMEEIQGKSKKEEKKQEKNEIPETSQFTPYRVHPTLSKIFPNAKPHPASVVESAAMGSIETPPLNYTPILDSKLVESGALSDIQLEAIAYAGEAHMSHVNPFGDVKARKGFMIGDGTGMGKSREIAGIILDNWNQGRKKAIWVSQNQKLMKDAIQAWVALGGKEEDFFQLGGTNKKIKETQGVLFVTYDTLKSGFTSSREGRMAQILDWVGDDFDGVIAYDESHNLRNSNPPRQTGERFKKNASKKGVAGVFLQDKLPESRVVYSSATGMTEVHNLAYANRLGLWGRGASFTSFSEFHHNIVSAGVAGMEVVSRDMKAMGAYLARNIAYNDGTENGSISYETLTTNIAGDQAKIYNMASGAWRTITEAIEEEIRERSDSIGNNISSIRSQLTLAKQRFYNVFLASLQVPDLIKDMEKRLATGEACVIQLTRTMEAATKRAISKAKEENEEFDLEDVDISPAEELINYVDLHYPTTLYESYLDENDRTKYRPVMETIIDENGNPQIVEAQDKDAVARKEALIARLSSITLPESFIDQIIDHFGVDKIAEVSGRKQRLVRVQNPDGSWQKIIQKITPKSAAQDVKDFNDDLKQILLFSEAGGTGFSYHAGLDIKNKRKRNHYLLQAGWRADVALQGLGRTHRSNQALAPRYILMLTNIPGHRRFVSTIARRLDQLGALTKGQRDSVGSVFKPEDNLESDVAEEALIQLFRKIGMGEVPGFNRETFEELTGLDAGPNSKNQMKDFLNRLLVLDIEQQDTIFEFYEDTLQEEIGRREQAGTLDRGLETVDADGAEILEDKVVETRLPWETRYVRIQTKHRMKPLRFNQVLKKIDDYKKDGRKLVGFYLNSKMKIFVAIQGNPRTSRGTGAIQDTIRVFSPNSAHEIILKDEFDRKVNEGVFTKNSKDLSLEEIGEVWEEQVAELPEFKFSTIHMVSGVLLPVWNRLRSAQIRVSRVRLDDGSSILGRLIPPMSLPGVLRNLGVESEGVDREAWRKLSPQDIFQKLRDGDYTMVHIMNGWRFKKSLIGNEWRVELLGATVEQWPWIERNGGFQEKVGSKYRWFLPNTDSGADIFANIISQNTIRSIDEANKEEEGLGGVLAMTRESEEKSKPENKDDKKEKKDTLSSTVFPSIVYELEGDAKNQISAHEIIANISKFFDIPIRNGRVNIKNAAGIYKILSQVIRVRRGAEADLTVASHEIAHHLDHVNKLRQWLMYDAKTGKKIQQVENELLMLDYSDAKNNTVEGFAEFMRIYLTRDDVQTVAPYTLSRFEMWMDSNPKLEDKILTIKEQITLFRAQGANARADSVISRTGKPIRGHNISILEDLADSFDTFAARQYTRWKDEGHPLNLFVKALHKKGYKPSEGNSSYELWKAYRQGGVNFAEKAITHGVFTLGGKTGRMEFIGPALHDVLNDVSPKEYKDWIRFVYARHAREAWSKGIDPGIAQIDADYIYGNWEKEKNKEKKNRWERAADRLTQYNNALIVMLADAGVIDKTELKAIREAYDHYIPLFRVVDKAMARRLSGRKFVNLGPALHRRKGSDLQILDPVEATIQRTIQLYERATRQIVVAKIADEALLVKGMGGWVEFIPPNIRPFHLTWGDVRNQVMNQIGADEDMKEMFDNLIEPETALFYFRPSFTAPSGKSIYRVMIDGQQRLVQLDPTLAGVLDGLGEMHLPGFFKIFEWATQLVKLGATGLNTAFGSRNPIKDALTLMAQTKYKANPIEIPGMIIRYMLSSVNLFLGKEADPLVKWYQIMGGELSHSLGLDHDLIRKARLNALHNSTLRRGLNIAAHPLEALRTIVGITEVGPRLVEFKNALKAQGYPMKKLKQGIIPPRHVLINAINAANDVTTDFRRQGALGKYANLSVPYFNAPIEGLDKMIRTFKDNPKRAVTYSALMMASTVLYVVSRWDDEDYEEMPDWQKYGFWTITDTNGKVVTMIPRNHDWGWIVSAGTEAMLNSFRKQHPQEAMDWAKAWLNASIPISFGDGPFIVDVALFVPTAEVYSNWKKFENMPIVYGGMEYVHPWKQYDPAYTTAFAIWLGKALNDTGVIEHGYSPAKIDHFLDATTGGLWTNAAENARTLLDLAEKKPNAIKLERMPFVSGLVPKRDYAISLKEFNKLASEARRDSQTNRDDMDAHWRSYRLEKYRELIQEIRESIPRDGSRDERFLYEKYMVGIARFALDKPDNQRYPSIFAADVPKPLADIRDRFLGRQLYIASNPMDESIDGRKEQIEISREVLNKTGITRQQKIDLLRAEFARRTGKRPTTHDGKRITAFGQRVHSLKE